MASSYMDTRASAAMRLSSEVNTRGFISATSHSASVKRSYRLMAISVSLYAVSGSLYSLHISSDISPVSGPVIGSIGSFIILPGSCAVEFHNPPVSTTSTV